MVPVAVDGLVASLKDDVGLVAGVELAVDDDLAEGTVVEADLSNRPNDEPNQMWMVKLARSGSKRARFNPYHASMATGMINRVVDGLVVLEIGL